MKLLVIHQNFPGQFRALVDVWARRPGWDVRALGHQTCPGIPGFHGLERYSLARHLDKGVHHYVRQMDSAVLRGQAVARALIDLKKRGFTPDVIVAHPGWGETLFAKDVFPDVRLVHFAEWYYGGPGSDMDFDPEFPTSIDDRARIRTWNALHALNMTQCDVALSPTRWQRDRHPAPLRSQIIVQHEGIDVEALRRAREAAGPSPRLRTPSGLVLSKGDEVVTFVARNLEPYRGFHVFMRALAMAQHRHRRLHAVIVGGDEVSYGRRPEGAQSWRAKMLAETHVDPARTHFMGRLPYDQYLRCLSLSKAHVYMTYPFVLSWSMLEAMASGVPIIGSATPPVQEFLQSGVNGHLVDFFDVKGLADAMSSLNELPLAAYAAAGLDTVGPLSVSAGVEGYDRAIGLAPMVLDQGGALDTSPSLQFA